MTEMLSLALDSVVMLGALRRFSEALSSRNSPQNNEFLSVIIRTLSKSQVADMSCPRHDPRHHALWLFVKRLAFHAKNGVQLRYKAFAT